MESKQFINWSAVSSLATNGKNNTLFRRDKENTLKSEIPQKFLKAVEKVLRDIKFDKVMNELKSK